jgi:glycogen debranching enzyme
MLSRPLTLALLEILAISLAASAQAIPAFPLRQDGPVLRQHVEAGQPFTVAGPEGILVGQQQGPFEAWVLPVKLLSHLTIQADVEDYPVPLDLNSMAREIEVRPDRTTITYSHIAVTVRQIMFSPDAAPAGTGPIVLFQVDAVRPVNLVLRFTADMREMWPMPSYGTPSPEWVQQGSTGFYALHTDSNALTGAVAMPGATVGIMAPYQERPQVHELELHLHVDPKTDRNRFFPLLLAVGQTPQTASTASLAATLKGLDLQIPALYAAHTERLERAEQAATRLITPDEALNSDFAWAQTSIAQLRAKAPSGETALVAGYYASGDSARPGFGWFFGRDALYTLYAVDSYGDFPLARTELEFLLKRQRADGKIMHEYSQTAGELLPPNDWASLPYEYAAADATPLFLTVLFDYVQSSGDLAYLRAHREAVLKAWHFETTHDSDGDGIYDNAQGTGWVESWPPGMPHQEIYLALLDQQASSAMSSLASLLDEPKLAAEAATRSKRLHATIEDEYFLPNTQTYGFSYNGPGKLDITSTLFPAIAYWNTPTPDSALAHPEAALRQWSSHEFATDWGTRDLAESDPLYDPISYHQGSVWPLFTGWAALAQYRTGHPLAGYQAAMQNADLTTAQDLGAVTELLSGAFFEPFGRSTSHQLWSSAMVVTPLMRGLFGLEPDALHHSLRVTPNLPADWPSAEIRNLHIGLSTLNLTFRREDATLVVSAQTLTGPGIALTGPNGGPDAQNQLRIPLPPVEVSLPHALPLPGARTHQLKVLNETRTPRSYTLELEAPAGTELHLHLHRNDPTIQLQAQGATLLNDDLAITFPAGTGYQGQTFTLTW